MEKMRKEVPWKSSLPGGSSLYQQALSLWEDSSLGKREKEIPVVGFKEKQETEKAILNFSEEMEKSKSKEQLERGLKEFLIKGPIFASPGKTILQDPAFFRSSEEFLEKVQKYEPDFPREDTGQALRNVWIMNLLQKAFGVTVSCTDGVFGYSMLYPYTDNFMDDPKISKGEKYLACDRLNRRLAGEKDTPRGRKEEKIFHMIEKIEKTFPRASYPRVFQSLLYIHHSQRESLRQQTLIVKSEERKKAQREEEVLQISFPKGGASVLADGYLVKGNLLPEEEKFCYNYGVLLQMADDLQDCKEDYENQHHTLFSMDYAREPLDGKARQLIVFSEKVFGDAQGIMKAVEMPLFLFEHTLWLILGSVLMTPSGFTPDFLQWAEDRLPVSRRFLETQREIIMKKVKNSRFMTGEKFGETVVK